jgi:hypothetical protein
MDRLDWTLLQNGAISLDWQRSLFDRDVQWLEDHKYVINLIDCSDIDGFRSRMTCVLRFKENYGYEPWGGNLDALNDAFGDLDFDAAEGIAFCFTRIDLLAAGDPDLVQTVLDLIESHSSNYLLFGCRLLALVQSDDGKIRFDSVGARRVNWNCQERLNARRGL